MARELAASVAVNNNAFGKFASPQCHGQRITNQLRINGNGKFEGYLFDGSGKSVTGTTTVQANMWYYVTLAATNNGQMKLYVNGQPEGTPANIGTMTVGGTRYWLGSNSGGGFGWFNGLADEVKLYKTALSDSEILSMFASQ